MAQRPPVLFGVIARGALGRLLGRDGAADVVALTAERYQLPPALAGTRAGRVDLRIASYLLALRDALVHSGMPMDQAEKLLADTMYRLMRWLQQPLNLVAATVHPGSRLARTRLREQLARRAFYRRPDWVMTDVDAPGCYAFDVRRCLYADYLGGRGEGTFCERVLCDQDLRMAEGHGEVLLRTGTLAGGADRCDFRYVVGDRDVGQVQPVQKRSPRLPR